MVDVTMPNGDLVAFPDDMPRDQIKAMIVKKFPRAEREAQARTGAKPYENAGQVALKGLTNLPQTIAGSANSMAVLAAEGAQDILKEPTLDEGVVPLIGKDGKPVPVMSDPISRATRAVVNSIPGANAALTQTAADIATDQARRRAESDATLAANAPDVAPGSLEDYAYQVTMAGADMAAPMAASILVRNPAPMAAYGAFRSGAEGYQKARDAGLDPDKARLAAGLYAAAEAVTEGIGGKLLLDGGKTLVRAIVKGVISEGATEAATEALQAGIDAGIIGEEMTIADALERIKQAAIVGGVTGAPFGALGHGTKPGEPAAPDTPAADAVEPAAEVADPIAIENQFALPAPDVMLALPPPTEPPNIARRQAPAPEQPVEAAVRAENEAVFQAQNAVQKTRQAETAALLQTARETVAPLGNFTPEEVDAATGNKLVTKTVDGQLMVSYGQNGKLHPATQHADGTITSPGADADMRRAQSGTQSAVQRVKTWRMQTGKPVDAPITIEDMARAKVPRTVIDSAIAARRPMTEGEVLSPTDVRNAAVSKNIIEDNNFKELAFRTTGARDINRMNQVQLGALHSTLEALPVNDKPVTVPIADSSPFNEGQYNKAVDAIRTQGRFTLKAIKDATGLKTDKDAHAVRDAMVRRGQLVQRAKDDFRLYDVLGTERKTTPAELPKGAFSEHVIKRLPVNKVQVKVNGKSVGLFASGTEARDKVRAERAKDPKAQIELGQSADVAYGVMENRYDEAGNLLGQVVVDTARDETAARKLADQRNNPVDGARYTQETVTPTGLADAAPAPQRPPAPAALAGRTKEIAANLNAIAKQRGLPLLGTKVTIQSDIRAPDGTSVEGVYLQNLIAISAARLDADMTTAEVTDALAQVMDHEVIHALKQSGVLGPETEGWKTIVRYANKAKRPGENVTYFDWAQRQYAGVPGYTTRADFEEEAIAEAFRVWAANKRNVVGKPATVFRQLVEWFKRLFSSIPNDVFTDIETGKLVRDALTPPGANQPRAKAGKEMMDAQIAVQNAMAAEDINAARVNSRQFLRARAQAREDRYGRSGPKTVLGTTPTKAYDVAAVVERPIIDLITDKYRETSGMQTTGLATYLPEDIDFLKRVADAQQKARHDPDALDVAKSYRALINETKAMFDNLGTLAVERFVGDGAPYDSPEAMFADIAEGRLKMRLSDDMFGAGPDNPGHPMNAASGRAATDGTPLTNNDLFRVVHDVYGRAPNGLRADPRADFNAYHEHARLLSPEARGALATETLAQSAWHHYGPHLRRNDGTVPRLGAIDYLPPSRKEFAEQKAFLLPDELIAADPGWKLADDAAIAVDDASQADIGDKVRYMVAYHGSPVSGITRMSREFAGSGEGNATFGAGLYFSNKREVADYYREQESRRSGSKGSTYLADIPSENELAVFDVSMNKQTPEIQAKLATLVEKLPPTRINPSAKDLWRTGRPLPVSALYDAVADELGSANAASQAFKDAGIPGHRYESSETKGTPWGVGHPGDNEMNKWRVAKVYGRDAEYFDTEEEADRVAAEKNADRTHNYVIYDDSRIQILEENPKFSVFKDQLPGGGLYGNPNRSPGGALSRPDIPSPAFTNTRDGDRFFGGEMADEQLRMAVEGTDGTTMIYLTPDEFLAMADPRTNPEQEVYDAAVAEGFKFNTLPSLVVDGYAGIVRAPASDGAFAARTLAGQADLIPVILYPKRKENLGLVTAIEANGMKVPWPHVGVQENFIDNRGPRYSVGSEKFKAWFGDSKVVDAAGQPKPVYHGTREDFTRFEQQTEDGIFFSDNPAVASDYAQNAEFRSGEAENVMPVFLALQNPLEVDYRAHLAQLYAEGQTVSEEDARGVFAAEVVNELAAQAKAEGRDGVILQGIRDGYSGDGGDLATTYIAFEPTQIKSAIGNNGEWNAADPDIRYSLNAPYGSRVPSTPPDTANIVDQRIDSWVGKRLHNIGRSKRNILGTTVFDARVKFQDKMLSVKEMIENIKAMNGKVDDTTDVYMIEQLAGSRTVHLIEDRTNKLYEPLFEALDAAGKGKNPVSVKEFEDFLYARHAPERNTYLRARGSKIQNPSGMSDAEAEAILDKSAIDGKYGVLQQLANMADAIAKDTTRTRVEAGLITQAAADASPYEHYVPLRGKTEEDLDPEDVYDPQTRARSGKGYTVGGREDRAVTGRERKAGDIISHLMLQNTEAVIRSEKNRVALSFMRLIADNPQTGYGKILTAAPTRQVVGANGMIREAGDPSYRQRPDVFTAKYNGKEVIAQVNDPRVARAMKSDYVSQSGAFVNFLGRINRYLATINTSWNPEFLISNLARDMQTAGILGAQYDIKGLSGKIIKGAPSAMLGIREVLRDGTTNSPMAKAFKEMQDAGGTTEFLGLHDLDTHVRRLRRVAANTGLNPTARQALERVKMIGDFIDDYNKVAENAFRLGAYVAARDAGVSVDKAAFLAKNLTVNFNKGGENKSLMNSLYLFYNASISGTFVLMNGLKNKRVQKIVAGIAVAGALSDLLNRALSGDEDDNGVKDYDDIPDYVLETNWVFMLPGSKDYIAIPMPYGFNVFHNLGRNLSNAFSGSPVHNPGKSAMSMAMTALSAFNPMGGSESLLNFISPTFADPFMDLVSNEDFAGNQIVPERPTFGVPVPESQKYWSNTAEIPKWVAEQLNRLSGGNEVRKGSVDVSPEVLQFWFDYATGATGKFATRNAGLGMNVVQGNFEDIKIGDIPFARRVVGSVTNRGNTERYYENATEVSTVAEELELAEDQGDVALYDTILQRSGVQADLIPIFEDAEKELSEMRKEIRELRADDTLDAKRKRDMIRSIQEQQDLVMADLNKLYFNATAPRGR